MPQEMRHGGAHGDDDRPENAQAQHACERDHGNRQLAPAEPPQRPEAAKINEVERRRCDDGAERRLRQVSQRLPEKQHGRKHPGRGDQSCDLRVPAHGIVDGGAGIRGSDREPAEQARGDVGGAEADQLAVGIDSVVVLGAEAAR